MIAAKYAAKYAEKYATQYAEKYDPDSPRVCGVPATPRPPRALVPDDPVRQRRNPTANEKRGTLPRHPVLAC